MISFFTCNVHEGQIDAGISFYVSLVVERHGLFSNCCSFLEFRELTDMEKRGVRETREKIDVF